MGIFKKSYPYLIAGLPNLLFDIDQKQFRLDSILAQIKEELSEKDAQKIAFFRWQSDQAMLLDLIYERGQESMREEGNFSRNLLKAYLLQDQEILSSTEQTEGAFVCIEQMPKYFNVLVDKILGREEDDFLQSNSEFTPTMPRLEAERAFSEAFYLYAGSSKSKFIRHWFAFDLQIKNVQAAYTARKAKKTIEEYLVGRNEEIEFLKKNVNMADFGMKSFFDLADELFPILEAKDMVERERKIDVLRWNTADRLVLYNEFDADRVLAYTAQAFLLNRWMQMDGSEGLERMKTIVSNLQKIEF